MKILIMKLVSMFISKKKVIGWASAVIMAGAALFFGMSSKEFKDAVCSAEVPEQPAVSLPIEAPPKALTEVK